MKLLYVAGPYRAKSEWQLEQNIRNAEAVALELWQAWMRGQREQVKEPV